LVWTLLNHANIKNDFYNKIINYALYKMENTITIINPDITWNSILNNISSVEWNFYDLTETDPLTKSATKN